MNLATPSIGNWVNVAVLQFEPLYASRSINLHKCEQLLDKSDGYNLVVLPEMCNIGYSISNNHPLAELAEDATGPTFDFFSAQAKKRNCYIVYGYAETSKGLIYNSQNLIHPNGSLAGLYRKINLFNTENNWANKGNLGYVMIDTEIGRIGLGICMDMNFDNFTIYHRNCHTHIVAISSCWLKGNDSTLDYWKMRWENYQGVVAISNIFGNDEYNHFAGHSCIIENSTILAHLPQNANNILKTQHYIVKNR